MGNNLHYREDYQNEYRNRSMLCALRIGEIDHTLEWYGNYTDGGETPIVLMPERASCKPYIYIPASCYAIITKNGKFDQIVRNGGLIFCFPWTKI